MVLWQVSPTKSEGVEVRLEPSLSSKLAFHLPPGAVIEEVPGKLPQGEGQTSAWIKIQAISGRTQGVDEGWVRKCAPTPWSGMKVGGEGPRPWLRQILPGDSVRLWEAGPLLHDREAAPPGPAARRGAAGRGSHVCLCSFVEMGHVIPTLRLAAVFAGLKRVGTVTVVTNTRRVKDVMQCVETELGQWSSLGPADRRKVRWIACEDGCTEDRLEWARGEEHHDGRWGAFQQRLKEQYKPLLCSLARVVNLFVVDYTSWGMRGALPPSVASARVVESFHQAITPLNWYCFSEWYKHSRVLYHGPQDLPGVSRSRSCNWVPAGLLPMGCRPLPKKVRDFLDQSERPVVFVGMGSQAPRRSDSCMAVLRDAVTVLIQQRNCRVIWSVTGAQRLRLPEDFFTPLQSLADQGDLLQDAWLPQASLLKEAKVKAFISHCGWNSCTEAISCGKPMVCCPLQNDQFLNAEFMFSLGSTTRVQTWWWDCEARDVVERTLAALEPRRLAAAEALRRACAAAQPRVEARLEALLPLAPPVAKL